MFEFVSVSAYVTVHDNLPIDVSLYLCLPSPTSLFAFFCLSLSRLVFVGLLAHFDPCTVHT